MKKTIRDFDLNNKKVIIRVDFNVPVKDNKILDDNRIVMSLKTINYALDKGAKVILMSHLGRIKEEKDKEKNSLEIVAKRLSELLNREVKFINNTRGKELEQAINNLNFGEVLLMQNTRFEDLDGKKESSNDLELGKYWSSLGDIFINDAFGTSHRSHASNVGIASNLESGIGFLIEEEIEKLKLATDNPEKPFAVILGGAKVSDKIGVIKNLVDICDYILIGGGMVYTFLKSIGYNIGNSLLDSDSLEFCKEMLAKYNDKIILPVDSIVSKEFDKDITLKNNDCFDDDDIGLDIGQKSIEIFKNKLKDCNTVIWNGPLGYSEIEKYSNGTKEILKYLSDKDKIVIIGGGDTASAAINFGYKGAFTHISTGGGASLELLEGKKLPGIEIIDEK
ncbi:MAG: phosphoglycerate kinase [Firmicutes bacterium]|nr:phosphoglycerate kinase [Bacillota bacterium]